MTRTTIPRIALRDLLYTAVAKRIISSRLRALTVPLTERDIAVPTVVMVPTRHGAVRCYIYRPHPDAPLARDGAVPPVHINIHGGGFILTNPRQDDHVIRYLAGEIGAAVVNIDYSTAPDVQYPVAEEQCFDVLRWVAEHGEQQNWDAGRISVGGGSAGGKLTLNVLQQAFRAGGPTVLAAALVVPFNDATIPADEYRSTLAKPAIDQATIKLIQRTYFVDASRRSEDLASPGLDTNLADAMPPVLILSAEHDTLRPQVDRLAERLEAEGVPTTYRLFEGLDHSWLGLESTDEAVIRESVQLIGHHLRTQLAVGTAESNR